MHLSGRSTDFFDFHMSSRPNSVTSISSESLDTFPFVEDDETRLRGWKRTTHLYGTPYSNLFSVPNVHVARCLRIIILSCNVRAGHNSVVHRAQTLLCCPCVAKLLSAHNIYDRKRGPDRTCYHTRLLSLLIG